MMVGEAMRIFVVSYELDAGSSRQRHDRVVEVIKYQGEAIQIQQCVWIVKSIYAHSVIRDFIQKALGPEDKLFVGMLKGYSAIGDTFPKDAASLISSVWHSSVETHR
ncbi:hypothetical protein NZD89_06135 [Alicyclobacillus fastidiosus]|uniref:Uncharacterized protein n=1 Tax=Alicyclobacillus fastidiosus TaxID=392011 RepID=A0ABY6ZJB9_9BACL|nr:hypothetical protein [Alicyclobacillus fastidiosus]WAH42992.1 hypothetical protein NZD89_06135 [Alicyclobacillus fastidiosus]GMA64962.1 hypothetical protein GCM10025859_54020 [Alicyclobacillus fastidiosus]